MFCEQQGQTCQTAPLSGQICSFQSCHKAAGMTTGVEKDSDILPWQLLWCVFIYSTDSLRGEIPAESDYSPRPTTPSEIQSLTGTDDLPTAQGFVFSSL